MYIYFIQIILAKICNKKLGKLLLLDSH